MGGFLVYDNSSKSFLTLRLIRETMRIKVEKVTADTLFAALHFAEYPQ
jgi:hypothetical protein